MCSPGCAMVLLLLHSAFEVLDCSHVSHIFLFMDFFLEMGGLRALIGQELCGPGWSGALNNFLTSVS